MPIESKDRRDLVVEDYSETTTGSGSLTWISSRPPVIAHIATTAMVMTTRVVRTRFVDRDVFPVYVKFSP
jgi:hypothetical protein